MAIAKMHKVYLVGHQAEKERVLGLLQQAGMMEISDIREEDADCEAWAPLVESDQALEAVQELDTRLGEVRFALDFLNRYYPAKKSMLEALGGDRKRFTEAEIRSAAVGWAQLASQVYTDLRRIDEKLMMLRNEETRLQNLKALLVPWAGLNVPLEEIRASSAVRMELGTIPAAELPACRDGLSAAAAGAFVLEEVRSGRQESFIFLAYPAGSAEEVQTVLKERNFTRQAFPGLTGTPSDNLTLAEKGLAALETQRSEARTQAGRQVEHREALSYYQDFLTMERDKQQVVQNLGRTGSSFIMDGWIREKDLAALNKSLSAYETVEVVSRPPSEGEAFPVVLENNRLVAPFEFVTKLYGTPGPSGIDPTMALTPFFIVFFGLCMTDAGYGVVIALLAALGLWKLKGSEAVRKLMWVLFAGGISTVVFGALLGGWFGVEILGAPLFFNALADPMRMLVYSLALGLIQIFFGMGIQFYRNIRAGKVLDAVYDQGLWIMLLVGLLLLAAPPLSGIGRVMSLAGAAGLVLTQGRSQPTLIKKFLSGLLSLYSVTGYLSDVLSYSRLLALGLATGVIALAINTMAGLLGGSVIGYVIMVLLLIGGHTFNLVINTLGSYIHSSRLQYIEFYNRFYEGGGRAFVPFRLKARHLEVAPEGSETAR
jgi:V/A-type H+-transporting ATPase subunit I